MSRYLRKLRIAWSVLCAIICLLLIVLWVRSYWRWDSLNACIAINKAMLIQSNFGRMLVGSTSLGKRWEFSSQPASPSLVEPNTLYRAHIDNLGFGTVQLLVGTLHVVPHWFGVLSFATLATAPWISWSRRFSLRTLLIAMTLVEVVLGLVVWAARR